MPGREGSGPLGGGGGGFGGGNLGGGGFPGGGGFGGNPYRGSGFSNRGFREGRFGGGGIGGGGHSGGGYRGGLGWGALLLLIVLFVVGLVGGRSSGSSSSSSNPGSGSGLLSQPPSVQTQTALDLAELHSALDSRIATWENQPSANLEQHVSAADAGMPNDNNIKDIVYGKCDVGFFIFVVDKGAPTNAGNANGQGYAYIVTALTPEVCHPSQYQVTDFENDGDGWWFVYLHS